MNLQKDLKDLLTQSYSRINDLNGLINRRDMEEALEQNGLKAKSKARAIIANFHLLLDAFYKHLLRTIDCTVVEISDTLKQHSNEIEEYVMYTAQLCLIAEKFLKEDHVNKNEGLTLKQRLLESLADSSVLKIIDYRACVSLDLDINMNDLFALPFIHIVSQSSDSSEIRKVHSLKFEDLKQQAKESNKSQETVPDISSIRDTKQTVPPTVEGSSGHSTVSNDDVKGETIPSSVSGNAPQDEFVSRRPLNFRREEEHSTIFTKSARQKETSKPKVPDTSGKYGSVIWHDKKKKDVDMSLPAAYFQGPRQENSVRLQKEKEERLRCGDDTAVFSWDDPVESGYETLPLVSPGKEQELSPSHPNAESQQDFSLKYHDKFVPSSNTFPNRLFYKSESLNVTSSPSSSHGSTNPELIRTSEGHAADQSSCNTPNVMDRNLTLLQNCLRNAERQSLILQSLPQRHV